MISGLALAAGHGQGWRQLGELMLAFGLSSVIGVERQIRRKSAGLRTQTIVGTASALILLVSKYGFADVLAPGAVVLDPSRVAAQVVSGIGFLGAGLIITRRGEIRGLTTAAAVWETAAIGMAAGAGLTLLAVVVTALHFVVVLGYTALARHLPNADRAGGSHLRITYVDGRGVLRELLTASTAQGWTVLGMSVEPAAEPSGQVTVLLRLAGVDAGSATARLAGIDGVLDIDSVAQDEGE